MPEPKVINNILNGGWKNFTFTPFREGVEICTLYQGDDSTIALLRYQPEAQVPLHTHKALETVIVLEGAQSDALGTYKAGSCVLNPKNYSHQLKASKLGCVVLVQWVKPVEFL